MNLKIAIRFLGILWIPACLLFARQSIQTSQQAQDLLFRLETLGLLDLPSRSLTPLELTEQLAKLSRDLHQNPEYLPGLERQQFLQLQAFFAADIRRVDSTVPLTGKGRQLVQHKSGPFAVSAHGLLNTCFISQRGDQRFRKRLLSETGAGLALIGQIHPRISFWLAGEKSWQRGSDVKNNKFDPAKKSLAYLSGNPVYPDGIEAVLALQLPWFRLELGQQRPGWGPGNHGGLLLSANMPPAPGLKLSAEIGRVRFTSAHFTLSGLTRPRYLAAHRLEWQVRPGIVLAGNETVLYAGRPAELIYLNPLVPYHVAEHHQGDRDNNMLSVDFKIRVKNRLKIYGEFFLDDMTLSQNLLRYYGNKFAFLIGAQALAPFRYSNLELNLEYARIEPFVYSHYIPGNIYVHRSQIIGHWLGPNADDLRVSLGYRPQRDLQALCSFERIRHGKGDVFTFHRLELDGERKNFLANPVEKIRIAGIEIQDRIRPGLLVTLQYHFLWTENPGRNPGRTSRDHQGMVQLSVNY